MVVTVDEATMPPSGGRWAAPIRGRTAWFDLHTSEAPPCPTVNWSHVEHGKIKTIRATFDPRPLLAGDNQ